YGGTYFPPEDRHGLPGFPRLLAGIAHAYRTKKDEILNAAAAVVAELRKGEASGATMQVLSAEILESAISNVAGNYDDRNGGFGHAPKFPPSMALTFMLRSYARTGKVHLLEIVDQTLTRMAFGGIYDQIGGGFHRYSVDAYWLVPHFEKMLYDNALLSRIYLDAYLVTGNTLYLRITRETLDYVTREMTSPEGGFFSSQDADSEGVEGKYYVWSPREIEEVLGDEDSPLFCEYYGVSPEGNFEGRNILNVPRDASLVARLCRVTEERLLQAVGRGRRLLLEARMMRIKPGRDEKVLTSWNGLMLRSFSEAAAALDRDDYRQTAVRSGEFVISKLRRDGRLLRTYRDGTSKYNAYLEDYACIVDGLLSLYEATCDSQWYFRATELADIMIEQFWDAADSCFYFTSADHEKLIERPKEFYDNATPSGNSVAAYALLRLWRFTGEEKWLKHATPIMERMAQPMSRYPSAFSNLLCALDYYLSGSKEIAVVGDPHVDGTRSLLREIFQRYLPNKVVACGLDDGIFLLKDRPQLNGQPTVYVCENYACKAPVTSPSELAGLLNPP
ncbi:MAG TPA: thioredoxin domain-containing protein, partial [Acidobacteriota bacterium]|nr:thioredoxin domain-containing protein [Acidobacteriota bacterium]